MAVRVNKVTAYVGERYELSIVTLYRTNTKLAEITNTQLGVPNIEDTDVERSTYQQYLKDLTIHLLEQGGIDGFYWDPKKVEEKPDDGQVIRKFTASQFRSEAISRLSAQMDAIAADTNMTYKINEYTTEEVTVDDRYKDGKVKFGSTVITMTCTMDKSEVVQVKAEIRSGQICKPKVFTTQDGTTHSLNITTLTRLLK